MRTCVRPRLTALTGLMAAVGIGVAVPQGVGAYELEYRSPFGPCQMDCAVTGFVGALVKSSMSSIYVTRGLPPTSWRYGDSGIVGGAFSREVVTYGPLWAIETEVGAAKRFGSFDEFEAWTALYFRWKSFPWSDVVRTSVAISTGLNWASDVPRYEVQKSPGGQSQLLHYLSPEVTFGSVKHPDVDLVFRFHHRSGGELAVFDNTSGGAQYGTVGLRFRW